MGTLDMIREDAEALDALRAMGLTSAMAEAFALLPLVHVAWAEGSVSGRERREILEIAKSHGVAFGSPAYDKLLEWLRDRPDDQLFERALDLIATALARQPDARRWPQIECLLTECVRVAEASGGVRGFVGTGENVCADERRLLERYAAVFGGAHATGH